MLAFFLYRFWSLAKGRRLDHQRNTFTVDHRQDHWLQPQLVAEIIPGVFSWSIQSDDVARVHRSSRRSHCSRGVGSGTGAGVVRDDP